MKDFVKFCKNCKFIDSTLPPAVADTWRPVVYQHIGPRNVFPNQTRVSTNVRPKLLFHLISAVGLRLRIEIEMKSPLSFCLLGRTAAGWAGSRRVVGLLLLHTGTYSLHQHIACDRRPIQRGPAKYPEIRSSLDSIHSVM